MLAALLLLAAELIMLPSGPRSTYPFSSGVQPGARDFARQILASIDSKIAKANEIRVGMMTIGCDGKPLINPLDGSTCNGSGGTAVLFNQATRTALGTIKSPAAGIVSNVTVHPTIRVPAIRYPDGIAVGSDGNLWFVEGDDTGGLIGRITPSGVVTEFRIGLSAGLWPSKICLGSDGNMWFTYPYNQRIGRITPAGVITEFTSGITDAPDIMGLCLGSDGNVWFTESNLSVGRVGQITPTGVITEFALSGSPQRSPRGIVTGPDSNLWVSDDNGAILKVTTAGVSTRFSSGITGGATCIFITVGPDGNLWFTTQRASTVQKVGQITPAGTITEFDVPAGVISDNRPWTITTGPDSNLWFVELLDYIIGRITTGGFVTAFGAGVTPGSNTGGTCLGDICPGPDGNLWFTEVNGSRIGRITTAGVVTEFVIAYQ